MLSRRTQKQLWHELLARSAMPDNRRSRSLFVWAPQLFLLAASLYLLARL